MNQFVENELEFSNLHKIVVGLLPISLSAFIETCRSRHTAQISPFFIAVAINNVAMARVLMENGADIEAADYDGATPLTTIRHR